MSAAVLAAELTVVLVLWTQREGGVSKALQLPAPLSVLELHSVPGSAEAILASPLPLLLRNNTPHKERAYPLFPPAQSLDSLWLILPSSLPPSCLQTDTALHSLSSRKLSWTN